MAAEMTDALTNATFGFLSLADNFDVLQAEEGAVNARTPLRFAWLSFAPMDTSGLCKVRLSHGIRRISHDPSGILSWCNFS